MIAIIDYGAGNIFSLQNALNFVGLKNILTSSKSEIENADGVILPGVGAFPNAMKMLCEKELDKTIVAQSKEKPLLGICLGMQMLFEKGNEVKPAQGLSLIKGDVIKLTPKGLPIPHMGWNELVINNECPLLNDLGNGEYVYFVHSYKANCEDKNISAYSDYSEKIPAVVHDGSFVYGAQFHPEKSGEVGLKILKNFGGLL